jgi:ADP-heptose:LPS heptosyltransferase
MSGRAKKRSLSVKRFHGLGDVIMLLPVLDSLVEEGVGVHLATDARWVGALRRLRPRIRIDGEARPDTLDLDSATATLEPRAHRSEEFARILGVSAALSPPRLQAPRSWRKPFLKWEGAIAFAPEASHPSRLWPVEYSAELAGRLKGSPLILTGSDERPSLPCDLDLRGRLNLKELLGLMSVLRALICMDSGALHLAAALGVPTFAIFGGVSPQFRIFPEQRVVALQAKLPCCPCNKKEVCAGRYDCTKVITPQVVIEAVESRAQVTARTILQV